MSLNLAKTSCKVISCSFTCVVTVESILWYDPASVSDLCLDGSRISRLACPFLMLMLTSSRIALYLLLADYFTAITTTSGPSCGRDSSNSSTFAASLAKMITSPMRLVRPTRNNEHGHFLVTLS